MKNFYKIIEIFLCIILFLLILIIITKIIKVGLIDINVLKLVLDVFEMLIWPIFSIIVISIFKEQIKNLIDRVKEVASPIGTLQTHEQKGQGDPLNLGSSEILEKINVESEDVSLIKKHLLFEKIYNFIFGTQIEILKYFRKDRLAYLKERLENVYREWQQSDNYPALKDYPFDNYINYLVVHKLIDEEILNGQIHYKISDTGKEFLDYIEEQLYPSKSN